MGHLAAQGRFMRHHGQRKIFFITTIQEILSAADISFPVCRSFEMTHHLNRGSNFYTHVTAGSLLTFLSFIR